jgi:tetratricopeptide (TPR) repeat protein
VISGHLRQLASYVLACVVVTAVASIRASTQPAAKQFKTTQGIVQGCVRDSEGKPLQKVTVILQFAGGTPASTSEPIVTQTDSEGAFRFSALLPGIYSLRAERDGYRQAFVDSVKVDNRKTKLDLVLVAPPAPEVARRSDAAVATKPVSSSPEFFDEPQFTVAGVTQASNSGGHGSDTAVRTTEALAKATATLGKENPSKVTPTSSPVPATEESSLRKTLAREADNFEVNRQLGTLLASGRNPVEALPYLQRAIHLNPGSAETHHLLGNVSEKLNRPLDAVREYQRAAELDASEQNMFDWGAELLAHRAFEPATDVFSKGNRLFPKSGRMLVGLGVAWYARGSYDRATRSLTRASDLDPFDPSPYLFLGKMQNAETTPSAGSVEQFAQFARLQPDNALANYYYAVSLRKQSPGATEASVSTQIESLLLKALRLNPGLGEAHLQLGILYSQRGDITRSISEYREAVAVGSNSDDTIAEAHYRLGQAYIRAGEKAKAREEFKLHQQLANKIQEDTARERRDIQQFVISLRGNNLDSFR